MVVESVVYRKPFDDAKFVVSYCDMSIYSGVQDVMQLLKQSKRPLLVGIWGMTGIGKSTIAKVIYQKIGPFFEKICLLENISEVYKNIKRDGLISLQRRLLAGRTDIFSIESGKDVIKRSFQHKRVLIVLDDVDKLDQLKFLCGSRDWFGAGSKIIITTRDRRLLKDHGVDHIYNVKELNESESLALFNWGRYSLPTSTRKDFGELSKQLVTNSGGLPIALKQLGFFLNGKEALQWKNVLKSLERLSIPAPRLQEALEKSISDLSDEEKRIFLDIACFFVGMNQNDVLQRTQYTTLQISLLEDKSLITIDEDNKLQMHVMLQAMARDIIERESSQKTDQVRGIISLFLSLYIVFVCDFEPTFACCITNVCFSWFQNIYNGNRK